MKKINFISLVIIYRLWHQQLGPCTDKRFVSDSCIGQRKKTDALRNTILVFVLLIAVLQCRARTIIVGDDENAGFSTIQAAIDDANQADTIFIMPGIYKGEGNRDLDFHGKAITVCSANPSDPMIVSATVID